MTVVAGPRPFGDRAALVELSSTRAAQRLARAAAEAAAEGRWPGVEDVVVGLGSVTVLFDPGVLQGATLLEWLAAAVRSEALEHPALDDPGPVVDIPVRFDGPDLDEVASLAGIGPADVVAALTGVVLETAFLGFSPGFGYLQGLPAPLAGVGRRDRPRPVVPAGSVALAGGFAAVYPQPTPGGWHLVGRTGTAMFDPLRPPHALLAPGRRVRFVATDEEPETPVPLARPALVAGTGRALVVEQGGACSLVEDRGRFGVARLGVPRAGVADPVGALLVNRLLGNREDDAVLEVTVAGPRLRATGDAHVVVLGDPQRPGPVDVKVDGRPVPEGAVVPIAAGQLLEIGGCGDAVRAVLGVDGGLRTPEQFGSRSTDQLCGLGPRPLAAGDVLVLGAPTRPHGRLMLERNSGRTTVLRVVAGPDAPPGQDPSASVSGTWRVGADSNRVGVRLQRDDADEPLSSARDRTLPARVPSRGMVRGALQLPPGGEAIVLGPDHATVGGYPVPAVVIGPDLHRLAHVRPGDTVLVEMVGDAEAAAARSSLERAVDAAVRGWFPTLAG